MASEFDTVFRSSALGNLFALDLKGTKERGVRSKRKGIELRSCGGEYVFEAFNINTVLRECDLFIFDEAYGPANYVMNVGSLASAASRV